jgi:hypothetical protein
MGVMHTIHMYMLSTCVCVYVCVYVCVVGASALKPPINTPEPLAYLTYPPSQPYYLQLSLNLLYTPP